MSYPKLLPQQMIGLMLVTLFLTGCGTPTATPISEVLKATSTLVPSTSTPTLVSSIATPTPEPPTPTATVPPTLTIPPVTPINPPEPYLNLGTVQRDIAYCQGGELTLLMDIYFPNQPKSDPAPVIVSPGIGTLSGSSLADKEGVPSFDLGELLRRGYIVASIDRRTQPKYKLPVPFEDAKCAVRYLRANAAAYHLDPNRIGAWGCNMGGYMASILAVTDASAGLEGTGGYPEQSSRVQAVVVMDAPVDVSSIGLQKGFGDISPQDPRIANASSLTHISEDDPPFLIFVSEADNVALPDQEKSDMQRLYDGLTDAGVPATFVVVKDATHCFEGHPNPSRPEIATMMADFFDENLP